MLQCQPQQTPLQEGCKPESLLVQLREKPLLFWRPSLSNSSSYAVAPSTNWSFPLSANGMPITRVDTTSPLLYGAKHLSRYSPAPRVRPVFKSMSCVPGAPLVRHPTHLPCLPVLSVWPDAVRSGGGPATRAVRHCFGYRGGWHGWVLFRRTVVPREPPTGSCILWWLTSSPGSLPFPEHESPE